MVLSKITFTGKNSLAKLLANPPAKNLEVVIPFKGDIEHLKYDFSPKVVRCGAAPRTSHKYSLCGAVCDFYRSKSKGLQSTPKSKGLQNSKRIVCEMIFAKKINNWDTSLVLQKTHSMKSFMSKTKNKVDFDNKNRVFIRLHYNNPLKNFSKKDLAELKAHIKKYTKAPKQGGSPQALQKYNEMLQTNHAHINDAIHAPVVLNRNAYFGDILPNVENFAIYNIPAGIEYLMIMEDDRIHYISEHSASEEKIPSDARAVISAVKHSDQFTIRRMLYPLESDVKKINEQNQRFARLLKCQAVVYYQLSERNYKTCIKKHAKQRMEFTRLQGSNFKVWLWSPEPMPITFLAKKYQCANVLFLTTNVNDRRIYPQHPITRELFGAPSGQHQPVIFAPSVRPDAYKFVDESVEDGDYVKLTMVKNQWQFVEKVEGHHYGDDFKAVELGAFASYFNPIKLQDLTLDKKHISAQSYFINTKQPMHEAPIKMNNFVKRALIGQSNDVIDLASGRGSDLMNYRNKAVKQLLYCEIDKDAIEETLIRKYSFPNPNGTVLEICNLDLTKPWKTNLGIIQNYTLKQSSNIYCFFAFHYLSDTPARINNITTLVAKLLKKDGEFVYTAFNDRAVNDILKDGDWVVHENGVKKYHIIKKYKDLKTASRPIKLILPFNKNTYFYDENLINQELVEKAFNKHGIQKVKSGSFLDYLGEFQQRKQRFFNNLTEDDKKFIGLYSYYTYKKT